MQAQRRYTNHLDCLRAVHRQNKRTLARRLPNGRYGPASTTKSREPAANFVTGVAMPLINLANQFAEMKIAAELLLKSKGVKIE